MEISWIQVQMSLFSSKQIMIQTIDNINFIMTEHQVEILKMQEENIIQIMIGIIRSKN